MSVFQTASSRSLSSPWLQVCAGLTFWIWNGRRLICQGRSHGYIRRTPKRAGITEFRFHDLRHTWASWLVQVGVPLSALQEMGGWESIEMVRRYAHLSPNHLTEYARKIDDVMTLHVTNLALLDFDGEAKKA